MKFRSICFTLFLLTVQMLHAQDTLSVLFLGNSYTAFNNLPQLVQSLSGSAGKTLIIDSNMPGGVTVSAHLNDPASISKIAQGNWDYVVIQEQSQLPTIDYYRYNDMYPALIDLKGLVQQFNPCARLITYMTWGRRFGGQQCDPPNVYCSPVFVDFNHMQDSLTNAYMEISNFLGIQCAPVGVTWQNILNDTTLLLHSTDNSHPNLDGSYVAALTIFSAIWKQPSQGLTFNAGISAARALFYQQQSDNTVFNSANDWNLDINLPVAAFGFTAVGNTVNFTNLSGTATGNTLTYLWDFGDGNATNVVNPAHTYSSSGTYAVSLVVADCIFKDTITYSVQVGTTGLTENQNSTVFIYPNPFSSQLLVRTDTRQLGMPYSITDLTGRMIERGLITETILNIATNQWPAGIYMFTMESSTDNLRLVKY